MWSKTQDTTENDFSSNLLALIPIFTFNLVFNIKSSNSMVIECLGP